VVEKQNTDGFSSHFRDQLAFDGFLGDQPDRPSRTALGRSAADHRQDTVPLALGKQCWRSRPRFVIEGSVQPGFLLATSDLPDRFRGQLHLGRDFGNSLAVRKWAKHQPAKDDTHRLNAAAQHGIQNLAITFSPLHAKTPVDPHVPLWSRLCQPRTVLNKLI
jgi:hypothetical protein